MSVRLRHAVLAALGVLAVCAPAARAAEAKPIEPGPWAWTAITGLNLSQSSFSSNWSGGDKGAIVWVLKSDLGAARQVNRSFNLSNLLQLAYGQTARQVPQAGKGLGWDSPDKTTDLIAFQSVGRFTLEGLVDPYVSLRLDSQFLDQSSPLGDIQFNPVKLTESAGIARLLSKTADSEVITRLGFGFRQTLAKSIVPSTLEKQSFTTNDGGLEWQTNVTRPMLDKKVLYRGQLLVFQPVFYSKSGDLEDFDALALAVNPGRERVADFWRTPEVNFQNTFTAAITKSLSIGLEAVLVYDKFSSAANVDPSKPIADQIPEIDRNVRKAGQFKEVLAIGLTYSLF